MPFTNPILAGLTLIRRAIQSPNYIAGLSGWSVERDGSAEFNNATIRGTLITGSTTVTGDAIPAPLTAYYGTGITSVIIQSGSVATLYGYTAMVTRLSATYLVTGLVDTTQTPSVMEVTSIKYPAAGAPKISNSYQLDAAAIYTADPVTIDSTVFANGPIRHGAYTALYGYSDVTSMTVPNLATSATKAIAFTTPFPAGVTPHCTVNMTSAPGPSARWVERAISVTNTGFTIFLFAADNAATAGFTTNVSWSAVENADTAV